MAAGTIPVVEDDTIQHEGLAVVLRQQDFAVLTAVDGHDAINKLSKGSVPDLILLDMLIPSSDLDGWWFLQQRRGSPALASVPVIITTAISVADMKWAASLGVDGVLRKPFELEPLQAEIQRCLGRAGQG